MLLGSPRNSLKRLTASLLASMLLVSIARIGCCSSTLPRLETWELCRFFDASMPRFDASTPRSDTYSATLVTSIIASIASLVLSSDPPCARFFDAPTPRFDASMPPFDTCFNPGFDNRSKRLAGTLLSSPRNSLKYLKASSLASMLLVSIAGI